MYLFEKTSSLRSVVFLLITSSILTFIYASLMLLYRLGWNKQEMFKLSPGYQPVTKISVIVPARNEAQHIGACIKSISDQGYPKDLVEIVLVDDHSEDGTVQEALAAGANNLKIVSLKQLMADTTTVNSYKKKALGAGIKASQGELIVTTDADCIVPPHWLRLLAACYEQTGAAMIIAPVAYTNSRSVLSIFQSLDFTTMQGITAASHKLKLGGMANGANLAFSRAAFEAVEGYSGIEHLASGDDYLLLHKMQRSFPKHIQYLKSREAIVTTAPQATWLAFLHQRIRWASKSGQYPDHRLTAILLMVYSYNVAFLILAIAGFLNHLLWLAVAGMLVIKVMSELLFLIPVARFYKKTSELFLFPLLQPLHIIYIIMAGFLGMRGGYSWKGRYVK